MSNYQVLAKFAKEEEEILGRPPAGIKAEKEEKPVLYSPIFLIFRKKKKLKLKSPRSPANPRRKKDLKKKPSPKLKNQEVIILEANFLNFRT